MSTLPEPVEVARIQKPGDLRVVLAYTERQILDFGASEYRRGLKEAADEIERLKATLKLQQASYERELALDAATAEEEIERLQADAARWVTLLDEIQADIDRPEGRWGMHGHSAVDDDYFCALEYVAGRMRAIAASASQAESARCACKDRAAKDCPGEWEPGCDLGRNPAHVRVAPMLPG